MFEDYSPEIQDFIKNIGLYVFTKFNFHKLTEEEILQNCSNNSVEDIVQNYEEKLSLIKQLNNDTLSELRDNNDSILKHKHSMIEDLYNQIHSMKTSESENIQNALQQNNMLHELEKQNLINQITSLKEGQTVKELIENRFCDKKEFNNPTEQGDYAEKILDTIINEGLPFDDKIKIEDTSDYGGSGDRIITFGNGCRLMVEVKNKDPVKKTDVDEFERHYTKDFKEGKVDLALFLSYRTPQVPQKCKAIIPTYKENNKVIYFGIIDSLDKEQKKLKIKNCLEEIFQLFERDKKRSKVDKESDENKINIYNILLKELRDNLSHTDKSIKESSANMETLKQRRINIVKQLNTIFRMIHSENINVDKSLLDDKLYRNEIIERIKYWFKTTDDIKKKDWKKNMKRDLKETWSDYDLGILTRIKRSEFTI
jgi:hypothetical protein